MYSWIGLSFVFRVPLGSLWLFSFVYQAHIVLRAIGLKLTFTRVV